MKEKGGSESKIAQIRLPSKVGNLESPIKWSLGKVEIDMKGGK